jgi:outer membrane protein
MKHFLRMVLTVFLLLAVSSVAAQAQNKIATVDLRKLFDGYWKTKQAQAALNDRKAELSKEDHGFLADLTKAKDDYQKLLAAANDQAISAEERAKRQQAATDKLQQIKDSQSTLVQFERQAEATLSEQSQRMRTDVLKEIYAAVNEKAKAGGYTMVIDIAAETVNQTPVLLYTSGQDDLTAAVLDQLNAGAPINVLNNTNAPTLPLAPSHAPLGETNASPNGLGLPNTGP